MKAALALVFCVVALVATAAEDETRCEPGTTFMRGCNTCTCTANGVPACTKKACPPDNPPHSRTARATQECEPGTNFKRDCNDCFCTSAGIAACTKKDCSAE